MSYKLIIDCDSVEFSKRISELIENNWSLHGDTIIDKHDNYCQALTKIKSLKEHKRPI